MAGWLLSAAAGRLFKELASTWLVSVGATINTILAVKAGRTVIENAAREPGLSMVTLLNRAEGRTDIIIDMVFPFA